MYEIGQYVSYKTTGVCTVEEVTSMNVPGTKEMRDYYVLKPVYEEKGVIYCPVDHIDKVMRCILTEDEAKALIDELADIPLMDISNKKVLDEACKNAISTGLCREYLTVMKTLFYERSTRIAAGKKLTTTNERFFKTCQEKLCGELAVVFGCEKTEAVARLKALLEEKVTL